jgi:hypothetical protein
LSDHHDSSLTVGNAADDALAVDPHPDQARDHGGDADRRHDCLYPDDRSDEDRQQETATDAAHAADGGRDERHCGEQGQVSDADLVEEEGDFADHRRDRAWILRHSVGAGGTYGRFRRCEKAGRQGERGARSGLAQ